MKQKIAYTFAIILAGCVLFLSGCNPPTSGIFYELEHEQVITVRHSGVPTDINTSRFFKITNSGTLNFYLVLAGTRIFLTDIPDNPNANWYPISTPSNMAVSDFTVANDASSKPTVYAIMVGNTGPQAGNPAQLYKFNFTDGISAISSTWIPIAVPNGETPVKVITDSTQKLLVETAIPNTATNYHLYSCDGSNFSAPYSNPPIFQLNAASNDGNWAVDDAYIYKLGAGTLTSYTPTTTSVSAAYTDVTVNGSTVYVCRSDGIIVNSTDGGITWKLGDKQKTANKTNYAFSSIRYISSLNNILAGTLGQGLCVVDTGTLAVIYPNSNSNDTSDVISRGNSSSAKVNYITGMYSDPSNPLGKIYFTTLQMGLWSGTLSTVLTLTWE